MKIVAHTGNERVEEKNAIVWLGINDAGGTMMLRASWKVALRWREIVIILVGALEY